MELEELDDAYTHLEAASTEQLRAALRDLARDPQALNPLLMIAAPASRQALQVRGEQAILAQGGAVWARVPTRSRRGHMVLAGVALATGTLAVGLLAVRAGSHTPQQRPRSTSPVFEPVASPSSSTGLPGSPAATPTRTVTTAGPVATVEPATAPPPAGINQGK